MTFIILLYNYKLSLNKSYYINVNGRSTGIKILLRIFSSLVYGY